jgi:hypothetical protein
MVPRHVDEDGGFGLIQASAVLASASSPGSVSPKLTGCLHLMCMGWGWEGTQEASCSHSKGPFDKVTGRLKMTSLL